jgi:hypothetical protein
MNRIICSLLAAGAAALAVASPAHAQPRFGYGFEQRDPRYRHASHRWRAQQWRELYRARRHFYAHWNGAPWERARFERWYARRCAELRY